MHVNITYLIVYGPYLVDEPYGTTLTDIDTVMAHMHYK